MGFHCHPMKGGLQERGRSFHVGSWRHVAVANALARPLEQGCFAKAPEITHIVAHRGQSRRAVGAA
ncbi:MULTISPECIES: hypothetical protein [unclassified Acidisoma]|uniref:hypothetical protein n=1 Tax=unclassified Acidisoma TaxID=2634065 RepID=UPI00131AB184|nr:MULTISPECIES: hypothetical protein [unclassified Acidisoma]